MHGDHGALHVDQIVFAQSARPFHPSEATSVPHRDAARNPMVF
jgi:hypothetical protein